MRCLPTNKVSLANGRCLHDWHAEVIAVRSFNLFLVQECSDLATNAAISSKYVRRRHEDEKSESSHQPFAIKDDVRIHMYCSEAPCGDASMELIINQQMDPAPWPASPTSNQNYKLLNGRGHFAELGAVRRKPSRGDAPETLSKSCSDKLAMKQCTSLLSSLSYLLLSPRKAYLHELILPSSQHIPAATRRAFDSTGRMSELTFVDGSLRSWPGGFAFRSFGISRTLEEFAYSRRHAALAHKPVGSNLSSMWTPNQQEVLIGGVLQGHRQFSSRGSSVVCKARMWKAVLDVAEMLAFPVLIEALKQERYVDVKQGDLLRPRRDVKEEVKNRALKNWQPNSGDEGFHLENRMRGK